MSNSYVFTARGQERSLTFYLLILNCRIRTLKIFNKSLKTAGTLPITALTNENQENKQCQEE